MKLKLTSPQGPPALEKSQHGQGNAASVDPGATVAPLMCGCIAAPYPHDPGLHRIVLHGESDWRGFWSKEVRSNWRRAG